ncbi:hypothetical protein V2J09_021139 [Rumex salicifolius]
MVINFYGEDYEVEPYIMDPLPGIDDMDESEMRELEAATDSYLGAIAIAKEKQDEESLQSAVNARLHLQSFVFKQLVAYLKNSLIIRSVIVAIANPFIPVRVLPSPHRFERDKALSLVSSIALALLLSSIAKLAAIFNQGNRHYSPFSFASTSRKSKAEVERRRKLAVRFAGAIALKLLLCCVVEVRKKESSSALKCSSFTLPFCGTMCCDDWADWSKLAGKPSNSFLAEGWAEVVPG